MRARRVLMVVLAAVVAVLGVLVGLTGNPATSQDHWPGVLDVLRRYPWPSLGALVVLVLLVTGVMTWNQEEPDIRAIDLVPPVMQIPEWVVSRDESRRVVEAVCGERRRVGITTSLSGAGGFGKSTLARVVCADPRVRQRFRGRVYFFTVGRDVRGRAAVAAKAAEVTRYITGDTQVFEDPDLAGRHLGRLLDQHPPALLVLDDVWEDEQLSPFLHGGARCVRLITTRLPALLPPDAHSVPVDRMTLGQARTVLTWALPDLPEDVVSGLLQATGGWALLLRLVNRMIAEQVRTGSDSAVAAEAALAQLCAHGPAVVDPAIWDMDDPKSRSQAVRATVEAATALLQPDEARRFAELSVFAEDEAVPVPVVIQLWHRTGGLTEAQSRQLCALLERLSLLSLSSDNGGRILLHDVIRDYLRADLGDTALAELHANLVDAVADGLPVSCALSAPVPGPAWWQLNDGYLLDHVIEHLVGAGRSVEAEAAAGDLRWVERRLVHRGPIAAWRDLTRIPTPGAIARSRSLAQVVHLLVPTDPDYALVDVLCSRLESLPYWHDQATAWRETSAHPALANLWALPDLPHQALLRTLIGPSGSVTALAVAPDGKWLATASEDWPVQIWDRASGACTGTLSGHRSAVYAMAVAPDGTWLATAGIDETLRIWDLASGACTVTSTGHTSWVTAVAVAPDGKWLATASGDRSVRIWDLASGACTATLTGHTSAVYAVAVAPDGKWLATASGDGSVRIWDRASGACTATLLAHKGAVTAVAVAPNGTWLATASEDESVRIWDLASGACAVILTGHKGAVTAVAVAPNGTWLATASEDWSVRIWDRARGACTATLSGHKGTVYAVAVAPNGAWLATTGYDQSVRIWDRGSGECTAILSGHKGPVLGVAVAPDDTWLATAGIDRSVRIWDRASGECTAILSGHKGAVHGVAVAPDDTWLATASDDQSVRIWDRASGECTAILSGHKGAVHGVAVAPDGTWLATAGMDQSVRIWNRNTARSVALMRTEGYLHSCAWTPDNQGLAVAGGRGTYLFEFRR